MIRLMKAEWFRIKHTGSQCFLLVSILILIAAMALWVNDDFAVSAERFIEAALTAGSGAAVAVTTVIICAFHLRLGYHELAGGYSPHEIVLSKLILGGIIFNVFYSIPVLAVVAVLDSVPAGTLFLLWLCNMKIYIFVMCMGLTFKHAAVCVFSLMALGFETMPFIFFGYVTGADVTPAVSTLVSVQYYALGGEAFGDRMVRSVPEEHIAAKIIISFIVLAAFMYWLAYVSTKKRWLTEQSYK
ncbi:MAG: hypothetical protein J6P89_03845 [Oscillospiraceae bacterium]|nr:hypothetical protein [Oscillospiraceae bacterium]